MNQPQMQIDEKKLAQIQKQEEQKQQVEEMKASILSQILTTGARERLANIKLVRPDKALQIEAQLIQVAQGGKLKDQITEQQLIAMIGRTDGPKQSETKVQFKRRTLSSDEES